MHAPREDSQPWFKQFWPWFLISIPAGTIIAAMFTINVAIETSDGLVRDNYYKDGLAIHKDAEAVETAQRMGLHGRLNHDSATGRVELALPQTDADSLQLTLFHPTRSNHDQTVTLQHAGDGRYVGKLEKLEAANWKVSVAPTDGSWRISGRMSVSTTEHPSEVSELR